MICSEQFKCSVVIPTYNRRKFLKRALESVYRQSLQPFEVIVVDDGSTDRTPKFVRAEYPGVDLISQDRAGVSAARNRGISNSNGDWVAFLDSDDEWHPKKLEKQATWWRDHSDLEILHCDEIWIRNDVRVNSKKRHTKYGGWIFPRCLSLCLISPSAAVIHKSVFSDVGVFDESLPVCEDYDLWLRICSKYPVGYINEKLVVKFGGHSDQLSKTYPAMDRYRVFAIQKLLTSENLAEENKSLAIATLVKKLEILINGARKRGNRERVQKYERLLMEYSNLQKVE